MFLSIDELKEFTHANSKKPMIKWLNDSGYVFEIGRDGWPVVLRSHVVARLGGNMNQVKRPRLVLNEK